MKFVMIVAADRTGVIGKSNGIPWRAPADLKRFKELTMGHSIVFGRKTYESLPKTLEGRRVLVLTRNSKTPLPKGGELLFNVGMAVLGCEQEDVVYVGGGADVYKLFLPFVDAVELTLVHVETEGGDTWLPELAEGYWHVTKREERAADEKNPALSFCRIERAPRTAHYDTVDGSVDQARALTAFRRLLGID